MPLWRSPDEASSRPIRGSRGARQYVVEMSPKICRGCPRCDTVTSMETTTALQEITPTTAEVREKVIHAVEKVLDSYYRDARRLAAYEEYAEVYEDLIVAVSDWEDALYLSLTRAVEGILR